MSPQMSGRDMLRASVSAALFDVPCEVCTAVDAASLDRGVCE